MSDEQIKTAAVEKLARLGWVALPTDNYQDLCKYVEDATGKKRPYNIGRADYVEAFSRPQLAPAAAPRAFRAWTPKAHPRQHEIDAGQPPMDAMRGYGIGYTRSPGGRQGS